MTPTNTTSTIESAEAKGQLFVPGINLLLFVGCVGITLYFQTSGAMGAAYGLAITLCMLATTILVANFMVLRRVKSYLIYLFLGVFLTIELAFLVANLDKFPHGGYVTLVVGGALFVIMYIWYRARKVKNRYVEFVRLEEYVPKLEELSNDTSVPKYATHLVYLTSANFSSEIESKIIYSILQKQPKRADVYWLVHVDVVDAPYTREYKVEMLVPGHVIRIEFELGFRVEQKINLLFRKVVEDLIAKGEVDITSKYQSLSKHKISGDFRFVVLEKQLSSSNNLSFYEKIIMGFYFLLRKLSLSEERGFGLDLSFVTVEKVPLIVSKSQDIELKRIY